MTHLIAVLGLLVPLMANAHPVESTQTKTLCRFAPENNVKIPVHAFNANNEMTESLFNEILDNVYDVYAPKFAARGATFEIQRAWDDPTANAYAQQYGSTWMIKMFGGLARHQNMTPDGFTLVACHEIGHHLGGVPKSSSWASNEGQSDYFATLKCARFVWERMNNFAAIMKDIQTGTADPVARRRCTAAHPGDPRLQSICIRSSMGGLALSYVLASLGRDSVTPAFNTPDSRVVSRTANGHPRAQCRLDTYFAGALCDMDKNTELSDSDPDAGTCSRKFGASTGVRPLCWYKPGEDLNSDDLVVASAPVQ